MIAVTEITRAYAEGQRLAGEALRQEWPDARVTKTWFTNNDDRVCEICAPLDGKTVALDDEFGMDIQQPPAHVRCRCWIDTRTDIT
jgi:SPP1 gp7 family putative phage head morphogenesis protein